MELKAVSDTLLVVREVAQKLGVSPSHVQNMITGERLPARKATKEEEVMLLHTERIHGVTTQGILVIEAADVAVLAGRNRRGGRPRKNTG